MRFLVDAQLPAALARWLMVKGHEAAHGIVWVWLPNTRKRDLLSWFDTVLPDVLAALDKGETLVEVSRWWKGPE